MAHAHISMAVILMIRTWAIYGRDRRIGIGLALLMSAVIILECICNNKFTDSLQGKHPICFDSIALEHLLVEDPPFLGHRGCFVTGSSRILMYDFVALSVLELSKSHIFMFFFTWSDGFTVVFVLMVHSAWRACS